jgi:hypothetical protein
MVGYPGSGAPIRAWIDRNVPPTKPESTTASIPADINPTV